MSLRSKVLAMFLLLAAVPLLGLGTFEYFRSARAVEALLASENARIANRVAEAIEARAAVLQSDLLLLADNAETQRWLAERSSGSRDQGAADDGRRFLTDVWARVGAGYASFRLTDARGSVLFRAGAPGDGPGAAGALDSVRQPVRDLASGRPIGMVQLQPILAAMVPGDLMRTGFGERGFGMVVDRRTGRIIYPPEPVGQPRVPSARLGAPFTPAELAAGRGTIRYRIGDSLRVASYADVTGLPWSVVFSAAADEFAAPFAGVGRRTLIMFAVVTLLATLGFGAFLRRTTGSLEALTDAAAVVAEGHFTPVLPATGEDEVGRLSSAFGTMVARVSEMMEEVRASRQMAVLGEFAAQLSHEIRNPLTSIKLNLQKIGREVGRGDAAAVGPSLAIALREVGRLDQVVRGVLDLARQSSVEASPGPLHDVVRDVLDVTADQAAAQHVEIETRLEAAQDRVRLDPGRIKGALLNLVLNALEAMPSGGRLTVSTREEGDMIRLAVADTGPGIPDARRAAVFKPFATTKPDGTGLGLPLALRAVEEHGGSLTLEESALGARFVVRLPLSAL